MNSSLNCRFTEVQFCAKSDTNGGISGHTDSVLRLETNTNVSTRILDQLSGLSDHVLDLLSSLQMGNEIQGIHSVVEMPVIATHGDRCMLARAGAGQSDMTASTEYSVGHSVWM
ncbi:hypothetical protein E4U52_000504 [Claviceps spartinae]|nr:hypothetical protein E4U52_000504 [Claviceps spartinae]